jgi:hypothetical protein
MKIELAAKIGDEMPNLLYQSHELGNHIKALNSTPCSICRSMHDMGNDEYKRDHFHVSSDIGGCAKKTFKIMTIGKKSGLSGVNFLNDGHIHEEAILKNIQRGLPDGYQLKVSANTQEGEYNADRFGGYKLIGHTDALITTPYGVYGVECKAVKQAMFDKIRKESEISDEWYGQAQGYMLLWNLERWYFIVKHRETSKILMPIRVDIDPGFIVQKLNKLKDIYERIMSGGKQPNRDHSNPKDYECQWCPFGDNVGDRSCWKDKEVIDIGF